MEAGCGHAGSLLHHGDGRPWRTARFSQDANSPDKEDTFWRLSIDITGNCSPDYRRNIFTVVRIWRCRLNFLRPYISRFLHHL